MQPQDYPGELRHHGDSFVTYAPSRRGIARRVKSAADARAMERRGLIAPDNLTAILPHLGEELER